MARRDNDPYPNCRFELELNDVLAASFSECTGLQMETKVFEYKEGGRNESTLKFPENATYGNVTLKRGITRSNDLIEWQLDVINGVFSKNKRADNVNIAILLLEEKGAEPEVIHRWNLIRAFPVKWVGPELKGNASEVAIETLELAHEGIQIE
ncbi:MAG: phage tail protein [Acidobacteria bacterium]|nr:MAG: phage tail protein [Acidobacteriota bacterium]RPJ63048.1 MAG: phage tail protein [Acidobacteriota bacterium]